MDGGSGWVETRARRDRGGRFAPGVSGNPAGKRKGTRNRATLLAMLLSVDESGEITRAVIDRALAGDMVAARFCLRQILPKKRGREIELDLPDCRTIEDVVAAFGVTVAAMASGEITPDEALTVSKVLERRCRAIEARDRKRQRAADAEQEVAPDEADLHPTCNNSPDRVAADPIDTAQPPNAPRLSPVVAEKRDLHQAYNFSLRETFAEPSPWVRASDAPALPSLVADPPDLHPPCYFSVNAARSPGSGGSAGRSAHSGSASRISA
ncbi:MAG: hypothetical protein JWL84_5965 [Rhodospirillales bacterium]|nr:hypothetical protein [Rhodospirillales bacterium]